MKNSQKFLKKKGLKDTLYNVNYNPNQNRGLPEPQWVKGGLSALLDEYHNSEVKKLNIPIVMKSVCGLHEEAADCKHRNNKYCTFTGKCYFQQTVL